MNIKSIIASVSLLVAAGAAFAQGPAAQLTREQVIAETVAARNAGELDRNDATINDAFLASTTSTRTRAEVVAETVAARNAGELDRNEAYDDPSYQTPRAKTATVKAQLAAKAVKDGSAR